MFFPALSNRLSTSHFREINVFKTCPIRKLWVFGDSDSAPKKRYFAQCGFISTNQVDTGSCVRSEQYKIFAERVREEEFYGPLPVASLHQHNKKKRFEIFSYRNA